MRNWVGYLAWFFLALAVSTELASSFFVDLHAKNPGLGIKALALLDGFILYAWSVKMFSPLLNPGIQIPLVKISDFIVAIVLLLTGIAVAFAAIAFITFLISLLLAIPFGTIAYMAAFSSFKTGASAATLGLLMSLKTAFVICIVISEQNLFKYYRSLIIVILCSFLTNIIVSVLHSFPPQFLVSITDAIAALIVTIIGLIWILISLIPAAVGVISVVIDALGVAGRIADR